MHAIACIYSQVLGQKLVDKWLNPAIMHMLNKEPIMLSDDVKVLQAGGTQPTARVFADLRENQAQALDAHADFFGSFVHQDKVAQVQQIVTTFFKVRKGVYVNHRANRGAPFTVVKVDNPQFPRMSVKQIDAEYREPLKALGVEIVFSKASNSYLFRVR
jgi:hypothetical protein